MGVERKTQVIPASGRIETGRANFFLLLSSTVDIDLRLESRGTSEGFDDVTGGIRIQRVEPWDVGIIIGAAGGTVIFMTGVENVDKDDTNVFLQVATIAGTVAVATSPSSAIASPASVAPASGAASSIAANLLRRRITFSSLAANTGNVFVQAAGAGAGRGLELQPGMTIELETTAAIDIRNDSGAVQTIGIFEES